MCKIQKSISKMNNFKLNFFFTVVLLVGITTSLAENCPEYLGFESDGKSYYVDKQILRNWTEAGEYCHDCNLTLATISSPQQNALLQMALANYTVVEQYWTSARENRHTLSSLVWNYTEQVVQEGIFDSFADATGGLDHTPYQNCGMYEVYGTEYALMAIKPCRHFLATLCMTDMD